MPSESQFHWTAQVENNPAARILVPCFVPEGKPITHVVESVLFGYNCIQIRFHPGREHYISPHVGLGSPLHERIQKALTDNGIQISHLAICYKALSYGGVVSPVLAVDITWTPHPS